MEDTLEGPKVQERKRSFVADAVKSTVVNQHMNAVTDLSEKEVEALLLGLTPALDSDDEPETIFTTLEGVRKALTKKFGMCSSLLLHQVADTIWETSPRRGPNADEIHLEDFFRSFDAAEERRLAGQIAGTSSTPHQTADELARTGGTEGLPLASTMKLEAQFHALDLNGDGMLDEHEVTVALGNSFPNANEQTLRQISMMMTHGADKNSDGKIDMDEFISYFVTHQAERLQSVEKLRARSSEFLTAQQQSEATEPRGFRVDPLSHLSPPQVEELVKSFTHYNPEQFEHHFLDRDEVEAQVKSVFGQASEALLEDLVEVLFETADRKEGFKGIRIDPSQFFKMFVEEASQSAAYHLGGLTQAVTSPTGATAGSRGARRANNVPRLTRPASSRGWVPIGGLSQEDVDLLRDTFISLDTNGDGLVGPEEIENALRAAFNKPLVPESTADVTPQSSSVPTVSDEDFFSILAVGAEKFKAADLDLDRMLSLTEFLTSFKQGLSEGVIPLKVVEMCVATIQVRLNDDEVFALQQSFAYYDKNGDGFLDRVELYELIRDTTLNEGTSEEAKVTLVETIILKADQDQDGKISLSEFLRAVQEDLQVFPPILLYPRTMQMIDQIPVSEHKQAISGVLATLPTNYMPLNAVAEAIQETIEGSSLEEIDLDWLELLTEALMADASADDTVDPPTFSVKRIVQRIAQTSWVGGAPVQKPPSSRGTRPPLAPGSRQGRSNTTPPTSGRQQAYSQVSAQQQQQQQVQQLPYPVAPPPTDENHQPLQRISSYIDPETPRPKGRGRRVSTGDTPSPLKGADAAAQDALHTMTPLGGNVEVTNQASGDFVMHVETGPEQDLGRLFAFLDEDDDGFIASNEPHIHELAYTLMKQRHHKWTDKAINAIIDSLFAAADLDEDGRLNCAEFVESFTSGYGVLPDDYIQDVVPRLVKPLMTEDFTNLARILRTLSGPAAGSCNNDGILLQPVLFKQQLFELLDRVYVGDITTVKALMIATMTALETQRSVQVLAQNIMAALESENESPASFLCVPNLLDDAEMAMQVGLASPTVQHYGGSEVLVIGGGGSLELPPDPTNYAPLGQAPPAAPAAPAGTMDDYLDLEEGKLLPAAVAAAGAVKDLQEVLDGIAGLAPEEGLEGEEVAARLQGELMFVERFAGDSVLRQAICAAVMGHCPRKGDMLDLKELACVFQTNKGLLMMSREKGGGANGEAGTKGDEAPPVTASLNSPIGTPPRNDLATRIQQCDEALVEATSRLGGTTELFSLLSKVLLQQDTRRDGMLQYKPLREAIGIAFASNVVPVIIQCLCEASEVIDGDTLHLLLFMRYFIPKYHCYTPGVGYHAQHPKLPLMATRSITLSERLQCEEAIHAFNDQIQAASANAPLPSNMVEALRGHLFTSSVFRGTFGDDLLTLDAFAEVVSSSFEKSRCLTLGEYLAPGAENAPKRAPLVPDPPLLPSKIRQEILARKLILHLRKDECRTLLRCLLRGDTHGDGKVNVERLTTDLIWEWSDNQTGAAEASPSVVVDTILDLMLPALDMVEDSAVSTEEVDDLRLQGGGAGGGMYLCAETLIPLLCEHCPLVGPDHMPSSVMCRFVAPQALLSPEAIIAVTSSFAKIDVERIGFKTHEELKATVTNVLHETSLPSPEDEPQGASQQAAEGGSILSREASSQIATFLDYFAVEVLGGRVQLSPVLHCISVVPEGITVATEHIVPTSAAAQGIWRSLGVKKIRDIASSFTTLDAKGDRYLDAEELESELVKEYRRRISETDLKSPVRRRMPKATAAADDGAFIGGNEEAAKLQLQWLQTIFSANDVDQDGLLSLEEFLASFVDTCLWSEDEELCLAPPGHVTTGLIPYSTVVRLNRARIATTDQNSGSVHVQNTQSPHLATPPSNTAEKEASRSSGSSPLLTAAAPPPGSSPKRKTRPVTISEDFPIMDDELHQEFRRYDKDNNGYLSRAEFTAVYKKMENFGMEPSNAELERLFNECCVKSGSADGQVNFTAFSLLMLKRSKM